MYKLLLRTITIGIFILGALPALAEQRVISVGESSLTLPALQGLSLVPSSSKLFADGEQLTIPSNRLLALYVSSQQGRDAKAQPDNRLAVQSYRQAEHSTVSIEEFQGLRNHFRASNQALIAASASYADKYQPKNHDVAALAKSIKIGEARGLEMFNDADASSISMLLLVKYTKELNGRKVEVPIVFGNTVFLLHGKIYFLYVYHALDTPESFVWVKAKTLAWLAAAKKINP